MIWDSFRYSSVDDNATFPLNVRRKIIAALSRRVNITVSKFALFLFSALSCWGLASDPNFLIFPAVGSVGFGMYVYYSVLYRRTTAGDETAEEIAIWERRQLVAAYIQAASIGTMASYADVWYDATTVMNICALMMISMLMDVIGHHFASFKQIRMLALLTGGPLALTMPVLGFILGDPEYYATTVLLSFITYICIEIARYVRYMHFSSVAKQAESEISSRLLEINAEATAQGIVICDNSGNVIEANARAEALLGKTQPSVRTIDAELSKLFDEEQIAEIKERSLEGPDGKPGEGVVVKSKDGRRLRVHFKRMDALKGVAKDSEVRGLDREIMIVMIDDITKAIEQGEKIEELKKLDKLTMLNDREEWKRQVEEQRLVAPEDSDVFVCLINGHNFKNINETYGHDVGDRLLVEMSGRLQAQAEKHGMISGRLGGDQFVLSCIDRFPDGCVSILDDMVEQLSAPFVHQGRKIDMSINVGVSLAAKDVFEPQAALGRALHVLNSVREEGNSAWGIFDESMESDYQYNAVIRNELAQAIEDRALKVMYQPIYEPDGETIKCAEALCRWHHPVLGPIAPSAFVAVAEELGIIGELTKFMLVTAVEECVRWKSRISVAVNLSVADLGKEGLVEFIAGLLVGSGLEPERLCIEITETVVLEDYAKMAQVLRALQAIGVKTSIDDFGTGYSSLAHLHHLPADKVKVDRAFVVDIERSEKSQRLFKAVVGLGLELGFEIVVEGVETEGQLEWVRKSGVHLVQGFVFSGAVEKEFMRKVPFQGNVPLPRLADVQEAV